MTTSRKNITLEKVNRTSATEVWELRLYVAGQTPKSLTAFANLKKLCEAHLAGRYKIDVIDLLKQPQLAAAGGTVLPDGGSPSAVVVPKIATTTVSRGDTLWRLSQATYGVGTRYATIYKANRQQIRNPNLIYPGQVFVMPASEARH